MNKILLALKYYSQKNMRIEDCGCDIDNKRERMKLIEEALQ